MGISNMLPVNTSGLQLIKTQTIGTTVSSVTVTDAFSSTHANYCVTISGGISSSTQNIFISFNNGNSTSHYSAGPYLGFGTSTVNGYASSGSGSSSILFGVVTDGGYATTINIFTPHMSSTKTFVSSNAISNAGVYWLNGVENTGNSNTNFTIAPASGTLTGGTIRVYGYRN